MSNTELENNNFNEEAVNQVLADKIQDMNIFLEDDGSKSKKKKGKQPKEKTTKKGQDFLEYAKKNEIEVNFKYEENAEKKRYSKEEGKDYSQGNYNNKNSNYDKNSTSTYQTSYNKDEKNYNDKNYNNYNNKNYNNYNNNKGYKNYDNKNYNKKGYYNKNYNNQYNQNQNNNKAFNNKFDPINGGGNNNHPYAVYPNQYPVNNQMMRPDMMYYGQMPMNAMNGNQQFPQQVFQPQQDDMQHNLAEKGIKESLEYYLSLDNLNKDLFIRKLIDQNGYIAVDEILKFNQMVKNNATNDTILQLVSESKIIEQEMIGEKVCLRNKLWNDLKHNLVSLEELESKKNNKKQSNYNYNYVTMQNNYFMPMAPMDNQMMMQGGMPNMNQFMPHSNMMGNMGQFKDQN